MAGEGPVRTEAELRHPWERRIYAVSVVVNVLLAAASVVVVLLGADWLTTHPFIAQHIDQIRLLAVAAILALPAAAVLRGTRRTAFLGNAVPVSHAQFPELQGILTRHCERLGVVDMPELFMAGGLDRCHAFSTWGRDFIVVGGPLLEVPDPGVRRDGLAFALGAALGSIRLGHTRWWDDVLLAYVERVPILGAPLAAVRTFSCDRYGAFLAPEGLVGLVVEASGGDMLPEVALDVYAREASHFDLANPWVWVAAVWRSRPHVSGRLRRLLNAGLFTAPVRPPR
jgi:hypothetical protein